MNAPHLYDYSDFASEDETLDQWRQRMYPAPTRRARAAIWLPGIGLGLAAAAFLFCLRLLVIYG